MNLPSKKDDRTKAAVEALHVAKLIHVDTNALKDSETDVRIGFGKKLGRVEERLDEIVSRYPAPLVDLLRQDGARIRVVARIDPEREAGGRVLRGVDGRYDGTTLTITVTAKALHRDEGVLDEELVHAFDHLLGSRGKSGRLSEGEMTAFPDLGAMGKTIRSQFDSGEYFFDDYSKTNSREFLAAWVKEYGA